MSDERWRRIEDLFRLALEHEGSQRTAFLDQACAEDPDLRSEIESLLASYNQAGSFIETPVFRLTTEFVANDQACFAAGNRVGPYQVLREIGRGGMGAVYLSVRADGEYQKQVAIKFVKRGMDTEAILRRFRHERQILANLDHPNIAKLLDGGTTEDGLPYFVMDYVDGLPIDVYCDTHKLPIEERLKLFRTVCSAVHYAHQNHVVHRDLKPSNIFVAADGLPKLLDFGIAKLLNPDLPSQTIDSTATLRFMTPEYASPEQARGETLTAASDVYSLGVLLYELLTGHRPYRLVNRTPPEITRIICEEEPEKPSTVIDLVEEVPATGGTVRLTPELVSRTREGRPEKLRRCLAGDLDTIVLMALRKEPERRYGTVEQFSEDIRRHLEGLPVIARKDTVGYRTAKFIKRNRVTVAATLFGAVAASLVAGSFYLLPQQDRTPVKAIDSIAVLPFVTGSPNPETEYLPDGITETLINDLSQVHNLTVISRSTVSRYKGREVDPQQVGRELKVRAVLTGRVVPSGEGLKVNLELLDARDRSRIWSEQYNRRLSDLPAVQAEISQAVLRNLQVRLSSGEQQQLAKRSHAKHEAYRLYLKGRYALNKPDEGGLWKGIEYFSQAVEKDVNYALAYAGLADSYIRLGSFYLRPQDHFPKAKKHALKSLELDETLAEAHASHGAIKYFYDWDWLEAERELKRAIELNPKSAEAYPCYLHYSNSMGQLDEAIASVKRVLQLNPLSFAITDQLACASYWGHQYDQAIDYYRELRESDPNFFTYYSVGRCYAQKRMYKEATAELIKAKTLSGSWQTIVAELGYVYAMSGKKIRAQKMLQELREQATQRWVDPYHMAVVFVGLGEKDQALDWLKKAYQEHSSWFVYLKVDPKFDTVRGDARFQDLLRRIGLAS
jgi:serine/threonine protein kinase